MTDKRELAPAAKQLRREAIETQLDAAFNFCRTADNALQLGNVQLAREAVDKAVTSAGEIRRHVHEPQHVPEDSVIDLDRRLAELDQRIRTVEDRVRT